MSRTTVLTPKEALVQWAKRNAITPIKLSEMTSYSYMHCWSLLRGRTEMTADTLGRLVLAFGAESVEEIAEAMRGEASTPVPSPVRVRSGEGSPAARRAGD